MIILLAFGSNQLPTLLYNILFAILFSTNIGVAYLTIYIWFESEKVKQLIGVVKDELIEFETVFHGLRPLLSELKKLSDKDFERIAKLVKQGRQLLSLTNHKSMSQGSPSFAKGKRKRQ